MKDRYLIIADDFTGANDTGVQLCRRGFAAEVLFAGRTLHSEKSLVIDTESRVLEPEKAHGAVAKALREIDFAQFKYVIKKVDSTMRGNIAAEVRAVDDAFHPELVIFAPALPDLGRTTVDGVQRLQGVEICKTELSKDPRNPVTEDNLVRMLTPVYGEAVCLKRLQEVRDKALSFANGQVFVCDAESNEDLQHIVKAARASGKRTLYIGTAGLADGIMALERPLLPAFGVAASVSSVTNRQMQYCEKAGVNLVQLPVASLLSGKEAAEAYAQKAVSSLSQGQDTILLTDTAYDRSKLDAALEQGEALGMDATQTGEAVRELVGRLACSVLQQAEVCGVFLTGGDTALGMLRSIDADGSEILSEIQLGIPLIRMKGGQFDGMKLVSKAGAFGGEDAVLTALRKLKEYDKENE